MYRDIFVEVHKKKVISKSYILKFIKFTKDRVLNTLYYSKTMSGTTKERVQGTLLHYPETVLFHFVTVDGERELS